MEESVRKSRYATRKDFRERYTEQEVREIFEFHFSELTREKIEEEIDIIYHQSDADLSLFVFGHKNKNK